LRAGFLLLVVAVLAYWPALHHSTWEGTEGRRVQIAVEMSASGDWIVPTLGGEPTFAKPQLYYQVLALVERMFGSDQVAMRVPSIVAIWLAGPFLLFRLAGKVAGAWVSSWFIDVRAGDLAAYLMPPGVLAIALALNAQQILPAQAGEVLLSAVAIGTAAFELFGLAVVPQWRQQRTG
jgi:4-amino-4-deoxy-L-arabinose transferase-like glycosyltransferase